MPYRRRFRKFRRTRRPRRGFRKFKARVKRAVNTYAEHKHVLYDITSVYSSIGNTWREDDFPGLVTQGVSDATHRIGNRFGVTSFRLKGNLFGGASGNVTGDDLFNNVRIVVYSNKADKAGSALTPFVTNSIGMNDPIRKYNLPGLIRVYRDMMIPITNSPIDSDTAAPGHRSVDISIRFKRPLQIQCIGGSAHYNQTQLYVCVISDSTAVPNPGFDMGYIEMRYVDL